MRKEIWRKDRREEEAKKKIQEKDMVSGTQLTGIEEATDSNLPVRSYTEIGNQPISSFAFLLVDFITE